MQLVCLRGHPKLQWKACAALRSPPLSAPHRTPCMLCVCPPSRTCWGGRGAGPEGHSQEAQGNGCAWHHPRYRGRVGSPRGTCRPDPRPRRGGSTPVSKRAAARARPRARALNATGPSAAARLAAAPRHAAAAGQCVAADDQARGSAAPPRHTPKPRRPARSPGSAARTSDGRFGWCAAMTPDAVGGGVMPDVLFLCYSGCSLHRMSGSGGKQAARDAIRWLLPLGWPA